VSVRKRAWTTRAGDHRESWVVDYVANERRHIKTFARKKDADAHYANVKVDVAKGIHTPESRSLTVTQAAEQWLQVAELEKLERSTIDHYRTHVTKHIAPRIGATKLATLTTPMINAFRDELLRDLSRPMARKVLASFRSIILDARRRAPSPTTLQKASRSAPINEPTARWRSAVTFLHRTKCAASSRLPIAHGDPLWW
jgi:hypothetical protein